MSAAESAVVMAARVHSGECAAVDLVRQSLESIAKHDGDLRAFLTVTESEALQAASEIDHARERGEVLGPLAGVPIALKDNICYGRTTCASLFLEEYTSPFVATAAQRLMDAGAVVVGKTNLDEFGMGSSCENSAYFPTRNPWDLSRVPGGSSGGSAAAVGAGLVLLALGSDTGGSIRQPAAFCGIVGLKPTYGRVSRYGLVAYASSLDQLGPMASSVHDAAICLEVMEGPDPFDATSAQREREPLAAGLDQPAEVVARELGQVRVGVLGGKILEGMDKEIADALRETADRLQLAGVEVDEIDLPTASYGIAAYYLVAMAEASSNLARFDGVRYGRRAQLEPGDDLLELYVRSRSEGFGAEVQRRILLGTHVLSSGYYEAYYATAQRARRLIRDDYLKLFEAGYAAVLMPTAPHMAFRIGEMIDDPLALYLEDLFTVGVNLAGLPAISVPVGVAEHQGATLPIGVQLVAPAFDERRMLLLARLIEASVKMPKPAVYAGLF